ncbi:MAG: LysR family transcriptional regulator [Clostridia bacterium]|nr:LysR family transcriptional regulator [Clostridia bacterium]
MELRVLRYFLAVAREESITAASEFLHISQPALSRQLMDLERELGKTLLIRGKRRVTLTQEGQLLRKRAEELIELADKTEAELKLSGESVGGDIYIGGGEADAVRFIAKIVTKLRQDYPNIKLHFTSGDSEDIREKLDKGLLDFGIFVEPADITKYEFIRIPAEERWGVIMRKDSPLCGKDVIKPSDLWDVPLIISRQTTEDKIIRSWLGRGIERLNVAATYNLVYNAALLVDEGAGYLIGIDHLADTSEKSNLRFVPLDLDYRIHLDLVWKKYQVFSRAAELFLKTARDDFSVNV